MCEFTGRLIAWIDGELDAGEAARIEQHLAACAECRNCVAEFRSATDAFAQYCEAASVAEEASAARRWAPALCAVAAVAAAFVALIFAVPRAPVASPALPTATASTVSVTSASSRPARSQARTLAATATHLAGHRSTPRRTEPGDRGRAATITAISQPCRAATCGFAASDAPPAAWLADAAAIQITIPAEAMFPPGAMPDGVNFVADVSLGADGAVAQLRLRPRLVRFEKGAN
jgi:Putative zinc-finger